MRVKTFLFFILLVTGVAFSQQGQETGKPSFKKITDLLLYNKPEVISAILEAEGFSQNGGKYEKEGVIFQITGGTNKEPLQYIEMRPDTKRMEEIKNQALNYGLRFLDVSTSRSILMEGEGFRVSIIKYNVLSVKKVK